VLRSGKEPGVSGFNSVVLLGRCKATEELQTRNGKLFIKATVSVSIRRKNAEGTDEERTSLIPATIFGKTAEVFTKYVKAGDMVHLVGRLDANEWKTDSGEKRLSLSFIVEQLNFLPNERKPKAASEQRPRQTERNDDDEPDDIPF
jgi:single-strand DNA-binding protein